MVSDRQTFLSWKGIVWVWSFLWIETRVFIPTFNPMVFSFALPEGEGIYEDREFAQLCGTVASLIGVSEALIH